MDEMMTNPKPLSAKQQSARQAKVQRASQLTVQTKPAENFKGSIFFAGLSVVFLCFFAVGFAASQEETETYPQLTLGDENFAVTIALPNAESGFYRGSRFDWSTMVTLVVIEGREVFTPWRSPHDPNHPEHGIGFAGSFDDMDGPSSYELAKVGDAFIKVGVGLLERQTEKKFRFSTPYRIVDGNEWTVERSADQVTMSQQALILPDHDIHLSYQTTISVDASKRTISLSHKLSNFADREFVSKHYYHHFFSRGVKSVGPGWVLKLPYPAAVREDRALRFEEHTEIIDNEMSLVTSLLDKTLWSPIPSSINAPSNAFSLQMDDVMVDYKGSYPLDELVIYANETVFSPEPFVTIKVLPQESVVWGANYQFSLPSEVIP